MRYGSWLRGDIKLYKLKAAIIGTGFCRPIIFSVIDAISLSHKDFVADSKVGVYP